MRYIFKPVKGYVFTKYVIERIERGEVEVSLDLGRSITKVEIQNDSVVLPNSLKISLSYLRESVKQRDRAYFIEENGKEIFEISISTPRRYYKLMIVSPDTAPTLEISGIHMHRIKDITPLEDTLEKVRLADIKKGHRVLDVCTGLGYTAIYSLKRRASTVVTIEKDPYVLEIARYNPWSRE
ncbi:MAG: methyltransferase, partial [Thermoprotei archaeon]